MYFLHKCCGLPLERGPECVLPRHVAGDGPRHPVLLGRSHGDDGPQADRQAALQGGETNQTCQNHNAAQDLIIVSLTGRDSDDIFTGLSACGGEGRPRQEDEQVSRQRH